MHILEKIIIATVLSLIKDQNNNKIRLGDLYERKDIFMKKYNENSELSLEMTWEEYKNYL